MNPALLEYCYQMLKICASACHALLSMNECTTNLGVVEETQYSRLVCNICINVIHGVPCCRTNEPSVLYTCHFGCLQQLHPERRWQIFKRTWFRALKMTCITHRPMKLKQLRKCRTLVPTIHTQYMYMCMGCIFKCIYVCYT